MESATNDPRLDLGPAIDDCESMESESVILAAMEVGDGDVGNDGDDDDDDDEAWRLLWLFPFLPSVMELSEDMSVVETREGIGFLGMGT